MAKRLHLVTSEDYQDQRHPSRARNRARPASSKRKAHPVEVPVVRQPTYTKNLMALSDGQARFIQDIHANDVAFGIGPAGTGKTHIAVIMALEAKRRGEVGRIVLARPAVEAGERLGFLPGGPSEKVDPYMRPLYDIISTRMSWQQMEAQIRSREIEVAPIAFMRGRTLDGAFIILDEAQNATRTQIKMLLGRLGKGSKMVITGDPNDQCDLEKGSGLADIVARLDGKVDGVSVTRLDYADVQRHPLVKAMLPLLAN